MPRVARSTAGGIVYHVMNRGNNRRRLFDDDGDFAVARYSTGSQRTYVLQDANYNVTAVVDKSGAAAIDRFVYDSYGAQTALDANWNLRPGNTSQSGMATGFQGMAYDGIDRTYHTLNREYSPVLGRWAEHDPAGYVDGVGEQVFVGSNPIGNVDPEGLSRDMEGDVTSETLDYDDFRGQAPDGGHDANTASNIYSIPGEPHFLDLVGRQSDGECYYAQVTYPDFREKARFLPNRSWFTPAHEGPGILSMIGAAAVNWRLLTHERYHQKIAEVAAAQITSETRELVGVGTGSSQEEARQRAILSFQRQAAATKREVLDTAATQNLRYDSLTNHGLYQPNQAIFQQMIDGWLSAGHFS